MKTTVRRLLLYGILPVMLLVVGYRWTADYLVTRADRLAPRDARTGILLGAEPRDLGPLDSPGAVLLVHGFVGAGNNFGELPERLARRGWRVRVMRLPGHGTSPRDYAKEGADGLLEAVRSELAALRGSHSRVVVVGHSMGGALATLIASKERVERLVLGAPFFGVTYRWYYLLSPETWTALVRPVLPWVYKGTVFLQVNREEAKEKIVSYRWVPARGLMTLYEVGRRARDPEVLKRVTCPVLLLHSRGDVAASPPAARRAFEAMGSKERKYVELTASNHHIFWDHERARVLGEIEAFIGSADGR